MPLVDLANPGSGQLAKQLAGPFGAYLPGPSDRQYDNPKAFKESSYPATIQSGGDGVTNFDDPTYLGFRLMFLPDSPLFSTNESKLGVSSIAYLNSISPSRATYLKAFQSGIRRINTERPWYWQTIDGITDAWERDITNPTDPYVGTSAGAGITIGCLEAIDLKITALMSLYKMACYDSQYRRFMLPENLRHFNCRVEIIEIRNFRSTMSWLNNLTAGSPAGQWLNSGDGDNKKTPMGYVNDNTSTVTFVFEECEFDVKESGKVFDGVNNMGPDLASTSIKFSYGNVTQESQFSGYDVALKGKFREIGAKNPAFDAKEAITQFAKDKTANAAQGALSSIERAASGFAQNLTLGNVYGGRNQVFGALNNPQALSNAAIGAGVQGAQMEGGSISQFVGKVGGNIFPGEAIGAGGADGSLETFEAFAPPLPTSPTKKEPSIFEQSIRPDILSQDNIFAGQVAPGPGSLDGDNVYPPPQPDGADIGGSNIFEG